MSRVSRTPPVLLACALALTLVLVLALAGCAPGQSPAEQALAAAESSWADVRDRVRTISPQRATAIELALARARASAERGDWVGALAASQSVPGEIEQLQREIDAEDRARDARWDSVNAQLGRALPAVDAAIEQVAVGSQLPTGVTPRNVSAARNELDLARVAWTNAVSAREDRRWDDAMQGAAVARHRARRALEEVGQPANPDLESLPR
jgi:hypothetical protein